MRVDESSRGGLSRRDALRLFGAAGAGAVMAAGGATRASAAIVGSSAAKPSGKVSYWHHFTSQSEMQGLTKVMSDFSKKYPGASVSQVDIPNADFMQKFTLAVQSGSKPNVSMVDLEQLADMVAMGGLVDLTSLVNKSSIKSKIQSKFWDAVKVDGKIYGVPAFMFVDWLYYRPDYFQAAGISGPPTTWSEFRDTAKKLTDPSKNRYGFGLRGGNGGDGYVLELIRAFGSKIVDSHGRPAMDLNKTTEAIKFWAGLYTTDKVVPPSAPQDSYQQIMTAFETGQTAMVLHHTGSLQEITGALGDKFMTAPLPAGPAAHVANVQPQYNGLMTKDNVTTSFAWISQWVDTNSELDMLAATGYFPASETAVKTSQITQKKVYAAAAKTLTFGGIPPQFPGQSGWSTDTVLPNFQQVLVGKATPRQAAQAIIEGLKKTIGG